LVAVVDDAAGKERLGHQVHGNHDDAVDPEEQQVRQNEQHDSGVGVAAVEMALEPVVRCSATVGAQQLRIIGRGPIELRAFE
jgi:hypothetical protein